ncbi:hypothetical protein VPHD148_0054 [Vibrio phage D148]
MVPILTQGHLRVAFSLPELCRNYVSSQPTKI